MRFDLAKTLDLEPEAAVAALKLASANLLLPVDVDRHLREHLDVLDAADLLETMRQFIADQGEPRAGADAGG